MTDLDTQSSLAVQPELVLGKGRPTQNRIDDFGVPLNIENATRIDHELYPIHAQQVDSDVMRVCIGHPITSSFAVLNHHESNFRVDPLNLIEWSWRPNAHWQIAIHRHSLGLSTSRGLYDDTEGWTHLYLSLPDAWPVYGLGEKTGELNKQGKRWTFWNSDVFEPHTESNDALYQSIPFMVIHTNDGWMGLLVDNPGRLIFDLSLADELCVSAENGALDLYVFSGETVADVIEAYTRFTGRPFLPPKWALGYHQSRHSYESQQEVRALVEAFEAFDLPLDALYLDIMYMNEYRVFSFHPEQFPNPPELIDHLLTQGIRTVPIVDPGVKVDPDYRVYSQGRSIDAFVQTKSGTAWTGNVWPGESVWPDFFHKPVGQWWGDLHRYYTDMGVQGFWNDMNEPAVFNDTMTMDDDAFHRVEGQAVKHSALHNAYGQLMSEATAEAIEEQIGQRRFVLTRAGYAGIQRSAAVWTGDNRSSWEHLRMSVPMLLNLGLSGVAFAGADIGGFMDDARPELFARWMQLGCFYPFMRNHSSIGQVRQEPWAFGDEWTDIVRKAMHRRYKLLPYLYQKMRDAHETGAPVLRPMFWHETNEHTRNLGDQFFFGEDMIVAPIVEASSHARAVWLPSGDWHSVATGQTAQGAGYVLSETGMDDIPLFLRCGAIMPLAPYRKTTMKPLKELRLLIVDGKEEGRVLYRDDDGISVNTSGNRYARLSFGYRQKGSTVEMHGSLDRSHYTPSWQTITIGVPKSWKGRALKFNGIDSTQSLSFDGLRCKVQFVDPKDWL